MADKGHLERLAREMADKGKLIEAGWIGLRIIAISPQAPPQQLDEMRMAFFAGAQHLFGSLTSTQGILDPGGEPTENDEKRMSLIDAELRQFIEQFKLRITPAKGSS